VIIHNIKLRIISSLDALSQWVNVTFFPRVQDTTANESVSGRSYREGVPKRVRFIDFVCFWEKEHCRKSFENDYRRSLEFIQENKELYENPVSFKKPGKG